VANAFAQALSLHQHDVALANIGSQIKTLQGQIAALGKNDPTRVQLQQQLAQLRGQQGAAGPGATVLQAATPPGSPTGPHIRRDVEIGIVIGLLLAVGAVIAAENSDRRLRTADDLEAATGIPLLSSIPKAAFSARPEIADRAEESFQMLRTALTYFNVDRRLSSVAIVSPEGQDGKTTVAVGVATAAAKSGRHVILLDADLRLPQVAERTGLDTSKPGLGAVLAGEISLVDALVEVPVEAEHSGRLQILPAGPPPPNPAALVSSMEMRQLVSRLESLSELVVVDTPAALAVSDALPLVQWVSGAVVVVRANRTSRSAVKRLQKLIEAGHGTVLGVVATGASSADTYGYGDGRYGYRRSGGLLGWLRRRDQPSPATPASPESSAAPAAPAVEHDATHEIRLAQHEPSR
jgi:capsular exopolysaccharide synthesis family protein